MSKYEKMHLAISSYVCFDIIILLLLTRTLHSINFIHDYVKLLIFRSVLPFYVCLFLYD